MGKRSLFRVLNVRFNGPFPGLSDSQLFDKSCVVGHRANRLYRNFGYTSKQPGMIFSGNGLYQASKSDGGICKPKLRDTEDSKCGELFLCVP
jgi:hypothetical protein